MHTQTHSLFSPAFVAHPLLSAAGGRVAVALAGLAVGEVVVAGLALVAPAAVRVLRALALAVGVAAERVKGADVVAVAG